MNPFEMVVLIVAIVAIARVMKTRFETRADLPPADDASAIEEAARQRADIARLKDRVAVLERILTDRSTGLADEIERLRDRP